MTEPVNGSKDFKSLYFRLVDSADSKILDLLFDPNLQYQGNVEAMIADYESQKNSGNYDVRVLDARLAALRKIQEADSAFVEQGALFDDGTPVSCYALKSRYEAERINSEPASTPKPKGLKDMILDAMRHLKLL